MQVAGRQLKVLVLYYSPPGHTRAIAEQVTTRRRMPIWRSFVR